MAPHACRNLGVSCPVSQRDGGVASHFGVESVEPIDKHSWWAARGSPSTLIGGRRDSSRCSQPLFMVHSAMRPGGFAPGCGESGYYLTGSASDVMPSKRRPTPVAECGYASPADHREAGTEGIVVEFAVFRRQYRE